MALAAQGKLDLAVLDLRLAPGRLGTEIAQRLRSAGRIGVLCATGNIANTALTKADGEACISKPYSGGGILRALSLVREIVGGSGAEPPFPNGFRVLGDAPLSPMRHAAK